MKVRDMVEAALRGWLDHVPVLLVARFDLNQFV
jgi:hypothetical protein